MDMSGLEQQIRLYEIGFYVCLGVMVASLTMAVLFFFRFHIPKILAVLSGRQRQRAVERMKGERKKHEE